MSPGARPHLALVGAFPFPFPQGSQVYFAEQACALARCGARVTLVCYGRGEGEPPAGLPLVRSRFAPRALASGPSAAKPVADAALAAALLGAHRRDAFDAVLAHNAEAALAALLVRPAMRRPVVYVAHTVLGEELATYAAPRWRAALSVFGRRMDAFVARRADAIVALSRAGEAALARHARGPALRLAPALALEAPPDARSVGEACRMHGLEPGAFALYAGNLDGYQEIATLAEAAARAKTPVVVATHGAGDAPPPLRTVRVGDAGALRTLTHGAALAVATRRARGGFPIKLLNYMEAGRAIVARESIADPLLHGESGWLVADDASPAAWADAIDALAADPALRTRLGAAARATLAREHDPVRQADRLLGALAAWTAERRHAAAGPG